MGIAAGAEADHVAVEAMVKARNEGVDVLREGPEVLRRAATHNRPLEMALARRTEVASDHEPTDFPTSRLPDYPDVTATPANV
ncbi:hypothetical protein [Pseudonocardia sp. N23]|uniref:hypothetical protein n=1 Tax=Pseudonocardia sp. N23 TaxID=1987376 RepID=UPI00209C1392|nr:hypothetical protein [Pseudonocardia sp. N23]